LRSPHSTTAFLLEEEEEEEEEEERVWMYLVRAGSLPYHDVIIG